VALDESYIYWLSEYLVVRCPLSGCAPRPELVAELNDLGSKLISAGPNLYVVGGEKLIAVPKDRSTPPSVILYSNVRYESVFAVQGDRIYWTDGIYPMIRTCSLADCASGFTTVVTMKSSPQVIAADDRSLYWVTAEDDDGLGEVMKCPVSGCGSSPITLASGQLASGVGLALDDTHVYWTNRGNWTWRSDGTQTLREYVTGDVSRIHK
jgi:hypothetical protein